MTYVGIPIIVIILSVFNFNAKQLHNAFAKMRQKVNKVHEIDRVATKQQNFNVFTNTQR